MENEKPEDENIKDFSDNDVERNNGSESDQNETFQMMILKQQEKTLQLVILAITNYQVYYFLINFIAFFIY